MVDHLTPEKRSWNMSKIRSGNTKPEMLRLADPALVSAVTGATKHL